MAAALAGCAELADGPQPALRVEPTLRVGIGAAQGSAAGQLALARRYAGEGRWQQAADAYRLAAALDPSNADTLNAWGHAQAMLRQYAGATTAFERAVALAPQRIDLLNNLGYALWLDDRPDAAAMVLAEALTRDPGHAQARVNLQAVERRLADRRVVEPRTVDQPTADAQRTGPGPTAMQVISAPTVGPLRVVESGPHAGAVAPSAAARPEPQPAPASDEIRLMIVNGNGVTGAAAGLKRWLQGQGLRDASLANLPPYQAARTLVQFRPGHEAQARAVARLLPMPSVVGPGAWSAPVDVRVLIGHDAVNLAACGRAANCPRPAPPGIDVPRRG